MAEFGAPVPPTPIEEQLVDFLNTSSEIPPPGSPLALDRSVQPLTAFEVRLATYGDPVQLLTEDYLVSVQEQEFGVEVSSKIGDAVLVLGSIYAGLLNLYVHSVEPRFFAQLLVRDREIAALAMRGAVYPAARMEDLVDMDVNVWAHRAWLIMRDTPAYQFIEKKRPLIVPHRAGTIVETVRKNMLVPLKGYYRADNVLIPEELGRPIDFAVPYEHIVTYFELVVSAKNVLLVRLVRQVGVNPARHRIEFNLEKEQTSVDFVRDAQKRQAVWTDSLNRRTGKISFAGGTFSPKDIETLLGAFADYGERVNSLNLLYHIYVSVRTAQSPEVSREMALEEAGKFFLSLVVLLLRD